jgi:WhiB family redox-sensing transcriptional regulator
MSTTSDHEFIPVDPNALVSAANLARAAYESPEIVPCTNDPDAWFPEKGETVRQARQLCLTDCPIVLQCRAHALEHHEITGIWGGLTYFERRAIWKQRHNNRY